MEKPSQRVPRQVLDQGPLAHRASNQCGKGDADHSITPLHPRGAPSRQGYSENVRYKLRFELALTHSAQRQEMVRVGRDSSLLLYWVMGDPLNINIKKNSVLL